MRDLRTLGMLGFCLVAACAAPAAEDSGAGGSAIIGGKLDTADSAIVDLEMDVPDGYDTCTATFISQTVLLTAAHCVVSADQNYQIPANAKFRLMTAPSRASAKAADWISVSTANVHPNPSYHGDGIQDVAIVILDTAVDVTPIPILRTAVTQATVGQSIRLVGYGQSVRASGPNDGASTKRTVTTTLRGIQDNFLLIGKTGQQGCSGDSGGPALLSIDGVETIVGTDDLSATNKSCFGGDLYQRIDINLAFIDQYLQPATPDAASDPATDPTSDPPSDPATTPPADPGTPPADPTSTPALDGAALYAQNCASCHGDSKKGSSAASIQSAIDNDAGGMGSLSFLTPDQIAAIALAP